MRIKLTALAAAALLSCSLAQAQTGPLKVGFMLPYTGTYASLGAMTAGLVAFKEFKAVGEPVSEKPPKLHLVTSHSQVSSAI